VSRTLLLASLVVAVSTAAANAQTADTILVNGKIVTVDSRESVVEALAIRDGRIVATGTSAAMRKLTGPGARTIDVQGRTVIPGLIDSHLHAIRAALSFSTEVNWIGARSIEEALGRIRKAAQTKPRGSWLVVAGGWNEQQFAERRRPTQAELEAAAPDNPVYVQLGYGWVVLTNDGLRALNLASDADVPNGGRLERDAGGRLTGAVSGPQGAIIALFDRLPRPTYAQQVEGTRAFFRELNRLGMTGAMDPGGNNLTPADYTAVQEVWRRGEMTVRVAYSLNGQTPGRELDDYKTLLSLVPMRFGDGMLRFVGLGERLTEAMNNNPRPSDADKEKYFEIARWAAQRGYGLTMHWGPDATVDQLLTIFERVNNEIPIAPLRWSIAHLNDASVKTLERMKALGVGWTVQDAMYFGGEAFVKQSGREAANRTPPVVTADRIGVHIGGGTDAHRVASYNPFTSLQWFLDGKTVSGLAMRGPQEIPTRQQALRFYTKGSAWFSHDDGQRGSLEVGKLADLAVLSKDYLTAPVAEIGDIESVLTMLGGKVVYAAGAFASLEGARR
jgi:predicted amidohydrolase YtcJ